MHASRTDTSVRKVREKCTNDTPPPVLVDGYLYEIARGYNVDWVPPEPPSSLDLEELEAALVSSQTDPSDFFNIFFGDA